MFGIPDEEYGESVAAVIQAVPAATLDAAKVQRFVSEHLARYKAPKLVRFVAQLPRDDSGKILKRTLREAYWQGAGRSI